MKKITSLFILIFLIQSQAFSFCGFYVAKADTKLFNDKSQVILVRDGKRTVVTMSNDFKGNVKDFAMVVPVPEILREKNIRVVDRDLFDKIDAYSAPRMAEYYDPNPCLMRKDEMGWSDFSLDFDKRFLMIAENEIDEEGDYHVQVEAEYSIEEYDVLILSAEESNGLSRWLIDNGYKIPEGAEEVLEPYIKNDMKFFVVKVNLEKLPVSQQGYLRPLQIEFNSEQFMLPIRLGMANAKKSQDMLVYTFTKQGRVEASNYRTVKMPTDRDIPLFVKDKNEFGEFYFDLFEKKYQQEGRKAVFLEYAWNVTPNGGMKCDPCVSPPPVFQEFANAGVDWVKDMSWQSNVFFTRLHVRYSRDKFPQDLLFQETPNSEAFQCRYVVHNPAKDVNPSCEMAQKYFEEVKQRRQREVDELAALAGWESTRYAKYINEFDEYLEQDEPEVELNKSTVVEDNGTIYVLLLMAALMIAVYRKKPKSFMP
ncbi:MAG: DUF2330 domain-containing protein [Bacteroidota bacterium]